MCNLISLSPVAVVESTYDDNFYLPLPPKLVQDGKGILRLLPPYNTPDAVRGIEQFSHLWLIFQFHQIPEREWHATVRPPRLGGNERVGVFASRATYRLKLERVECKDGEVLLHFGSVDLVNGTPIFDIKPYIHYADSEPEAVSGFAQEKPQAKLSVTFLPEAEQAVKKAKNFAKFGINQPLAFIHEVIAQDPRPAYQQGKKSDRIYGMNLAGYNVRWKIDEQDFTKAVVIGMDEGNF